MSSGAGPESQHRPEPVRPRDRIIHFLTSVGGLLTAVATILTAVVTIVSLLIQRQPDSPTADTQSPAPAAVPVPQVPRAEPGASARVRSGPGDVVLRLQESDDLSGYIDLDSIPPVVTTDSIQGTDLRIGATLGNPDIYSLGAAFTLVPLPSDGPHPTEAECFDQVKTNGVLGGGELKRGARFCTQTAEGRTAYLRVVASPIGRGTVRIKATVWEAPA